MFAANAASAAVTDSEILEFLTAVQNGSHIEKAVPVAALGTQGYVLTVDGSHFLSMLGLETLWELRKRARSQSAGDD